MINSDRYIVISQKTFVGLQDMSWRCLQHFFSITLSLSSRTSWRHLNDVLEEEKFLCWRRLEDDLNTCLEDVLKTCLEDVLRQDLKMSSERFGDKQIVYWGYLYLTYLNVYLKNLYLTSLYLTNLRRMQNALIRAQ